MESSIGDRRELLIEAAIFYAGLGWPVLPLRSSDKRPLGTLVPHGLKDATTDLSLLTRWWTDQPDANLGIRTGREAGIVALDIDPRHGGDSSLAQLQGSFGDLPCTATSLTGGGGRHLLLRHPGLQIPNGVHKLGSGVDVRGEGGYIVAPPSLHPSGCRYRWEFRPEAVPPAPIPAWLLGLMLEGNSRSVPNERASGGSRSVEGSTGFRNDRLFGHTRFFAYREVCRCQSESELHGKVRSYADRLNRLFRIPIGTDEVEKIVKSVCSKVWPFRDHFVNSLGNRGAMKLEPISWLPNVQQHRCEIQRRQRLAASFAAEVKRSKSDERIARAVVSLKRLGDPITISSVARAANLNRATVWRHLGGLKGLADLIAIDPEIGSGDQKDREETSE